MLQLVTYPIPKALDFLLTQGINPNITNSFKQTLLHIAAQSGQEENVMILLQHKAPIDAQDLSKPHLSFLPSYKDTAQLSNSSSKKTPV